MFRLSTRRHFCALSKAYGWNSVEECDALLKAASLRKHQLLLQASIHQKYTSSGSNPALPGSCYTVDDVSFENLKTDEVMIEKLEKSISLKHPSGMFTISLTWKADRVTGGLLLANHSCKLTIPVLDGRKAIIDASDCTEILDPDGIKTLLDKWASFAPETIHRRDVSWLLCHILTYPSNPAFDVISKILMKN